MNELRICIVSPRNLSMQKYTLSLLKLWVLLPFVWSDKHWTQNPISVQSLSKVCLMSVHVQGMSIHCPTRYNVCQETLSNKVQCLSRLSPTSSWRNPEFLRLDKVRMWTNYGHGLDTTLGIWTWTMPGMQPPGSLELPAWRATACSREYRGYRIL